MRSAGVAEWVLSLVVSPERAAAIVGDLMEGGSGQCSFWVEIARLVLSMVWTEMAESPRRIAWLALGGFSRGCGWWLIGVLLARGILSFSWGDNRWSSNWWFGPALAIGFMVGRSVALRAPGRELPAAAATVFVHCVWQLASWYVGIYAGQNGHPLVFVLGGDSAILAGAIWARRRATGGMIYA